MGNLVLSQQRHLALPPADVFALLGSDRTAGWLFGADYQALRVGALVQFELPLNPDDPNGSTVDAFGRIASLTPPHRLVIDQQSPWVGRLICTLTPVSGGRGTVVRLGVEVPEDAVTWLLRQRGYDPLEEPTPPATVRIGVLTSKSGPASVFAAATENLARMAAAEVNADGGVAGTGHKVHVVLRDDASKPEVGAVQFRRMVAVEGCRAVVTNVTSEVFDAVAPLARRLGALLIYTPVNEGGRFRPGVMRLGERPRGQLRLALPTLVREAGGKRCYLVGNDYVWPRTTNRVARAEIERIGGVVVGEQYRALGTTRFDDLIEDIAAAGADLIVSTFVGSDEARFERQSYAAGLRDTTRTLSLAFDESTREFTGDDAARGVWTTFNYFQELGSDGNTAFLRRYRATFGATAPPLSSITESVYEAIHMLAASGALNTDANLTELVSAVRAQRFSPTWPSAQPEQRRTGEKALYLAESIPGGFRISAN
ncbi:ABC transporter substrate-binding protein [Goodfellowiella coeruleoviolacea]|uniref:Branched-chain amino acid transport system substrate-binding protein n=1 Tax=Goodfellowiella coeruleoviolacea TaxID=334858 RepID=A0AAE3GD41_9PSEU|nr:ABC transporter substrate-binding protein [Goodfellowiella coeruleoviolacea]MCP2164999.1 branched-chain amino acid transport system substrate-binding protein [Goodfellowiella coeruleoviolacea]